MRGGPTAHGRPADLTVAFLEGSFHLSVLKIRLVNGLVNGDRRMYGAGRPDQLMIHP